MKSLVPISLAIISIFSIINPAHAELQNRKISDITNDDLLNFCRGKLNEGDVRFRRGSNTVSCTSFVSETYQSKAEAQAVGVGQGVFIRANADGSVTRYVVTQNRNYKLNTYCRENVDGSFFNPINGEGRVFVGDGGHACYKTVNE
jgi:hypothetical protein